MLDDITTYCNPDRPLVLLLGRPNVGKSTLFNRLTGSRDALVDPTPGLTRDIRIKQADIDGSCIYLADSGGIEGGVAKNGFSAIVSEKSKKTAEKADLLLILFDIREGFTALDSELVHWVKRIGRPSIFVANKADSEKDELSIGDLFRSGAEEIIAISAEHGRGIKRLKATIKKTLMEVFPGGRRPVSIEDPTIQDLIKVALIGRPNVGKSSLFNALIGEDRVIVSDIPGTTRDVVDTLIERPGRPGILLADTAGIRRKSKTRGRIEKFSVLKAIGAIKRSDVCIVILDASEGVTDQDKRLIGYTAQYVKACITVYNKWDLVQGKTLARLRGQELEAAKGFIPYSPHINCSARTGRNVHAIWPMLEMVYKDFTKEVSTGRLNRALEEALKRRSPPISKGHYVRLYYATQTRTRPPTFLIFANYPDKIPMQYKRFLTNQLRVILNMKYTPLRLVFRERERRR